jgi:hypothetical protein
MHCPTRTAKLDGERPSGAKRGIAVRGGDVPQGASRRLFLFATTQSKAIGVPPTRSCGCLWYPAGVTSAPPCRERRNRRLVRAASSLTVVSAER